jgi:hypothetical protein
MAQRTVWSIVALLIGAIVFAIGVTWVTSVMWPVQQEEKQP